MNMTGMVYGQLAALAIALIVAACTDIRRRQIDNWLNATIALAAPLFWWSCKLSLWPGVPLQLLLAASAFAVFTGLFALRVMGGGDVKLLTALALWMPLKPFINLLIVMALAGGVLTVVLGMWHISRRRKDRLKIPYGVAIAVAGLWVIRTTDWAALHTNTVG